MVRVLSIGRKFSRATKNANWFLEDDVNINDYNVVFLDYPTLEKYEEATEYPNGSPQLPSANDVVTHLISGNDIVVLYPSKSEIRITNRVLRLFEWLPDNLTLTQESGTSVNEESIAEKWEWYFEKENIDWDFYLPKIIKATQSNDRLCYRVKPIVQNIYDRAIAARLSYGRIADKIAPPDFNSVDPTQRENLPIEYGDGCVYFLPMINGWEYDELAAHILRYNILEKEKQPQQQQTPEWVDNYTVPGENKIESNISSLENEIKELEEKVRNKQADLEDLREYKSLLFGNDDQLENIVPEVFEEIGFNVEGETSHGHDGVIKLDDRTIVLEITGTNSGVKKNKCQQVDRWVRSHETDDPDGNYTGLLIVNPLRETDPDDRSGYLAPDVEKIMDQWGHKILTSPTVFDMFVQTKRDNLTKEEIKEKLTSDETLIELE